MDNFHHLCLYEVLVNLAVMLPDGEMIMSIWVQVLLNLLKR